ncbi:M15 family metallopeptidase [Sphingomonas sp.]|uniref:M15 family metallopeptidase n=1 Tax=Sphingomonas sp. TaxID=28214 RepID=UPI00286DD7DC|nr:M15 family metallopeptidase [Sphingomonas sp.]
MSNRLFPTDILFEQRLLSCCGLYRNRLDGEWGPRTDAAERAFIAECDALAQAEGRFDDRSERNIRTLQTAAQKLCRRSLKRLITAGFDARVISGTRTYAEQTAIYRQGRFGNPGPIVSRAKAGSSWHNFGLAWDIGLFDNGRYLTSGNQYRAASAHAKLDGIEWGGDWRSFKDEPHYQVPGAHTTIASVRQFFEAGGR